LPEASSGQKLHKNSFLTTSSHFAGTLQIKTWCSYFLFRFLIYLLFFFNCVQLANYVNAKIFALILFPNVNIRTLARMRGREITKEYLEGTS
jgi:hypothetical protein